jgi:hypothetical protein
MAYAETVDASKPQRDHVKARPTLELVGTITQPARQRQRHKARAKVSNYCDLLPGISGNDPRARRFRDLVNAFIEGLGGLERISEIKLVNLRQLAAIVVRAEDVAAQTVMGKEVDINTQCTLASTMMRLSVGIGMELRNAPEPGAFDPGGLLDRERAAMLAQQQIDHDGEAS